MDTDRKPIVKKNYTLLTMRILSIDVGIRTLSFCLLEYKQDTEMKNVKGSLPMCNFYIHYWKVIDILRENKIFTSNSKVVSMPKVIECLNLSLDKIVKEFVLDKEVYSIIIERQPTGRRASNQKILGLSYCIFTWFHLYLKRELNNYTKIELFSSKHKGNVYCNNETNFAYREHEKKTKKNKQEYKQRKQYSIFLCWKLFAQLNCKYEPHLVFEIMYNWLPKKDDAADACIQGVAYFLQKFVTLVKNKKKTRKKNADDDSRAINEMDSID